MGSDVPVHHLALPLKLQETHLALSDQGILIIHSSLHLTRYIINHQVFQMAYCQEYYPDRHSEYVQLCEDFVAAVHQHDPALLRKQKIHLLHLPESMRNYGPTATFNTEL